MPNTTESKIAVLNSQMLKMQSDVTEIKNMTINHILKDDEKLTKEDAKSMFAGKYIEKAFWVAVTFTTTVLTAIVISIVDALKHMKLNV